MPLLLVCCTRPCPSRCGSRSVCLCCSSPCLLALLGAPVVHPLLSHPPAPPVRGFHISVRRGLSRVRLAGHGPVATPMAGTSRRAGRSPCPCGVRGHLVEGGGGGVFADGLLGMRRIWWLLRCSHLVVPLCIVVCLVGARLTAVCGASLCPVALLLAFLLISGSFFFCWHAHRCWCTAPGGQHVTPCLPFPFLFCEWRSCAAYILCVPLLFLRAGLAPSGGCASGTRHGACGPPSGWCLGLWGAIK